MNTKKSETRCLVVGASVAGLATAACLSQKKLPYEIVEREASLAMPWRNHYERLHLHTNKGASNLPYFSFGRSVPRYPSRQEVVDYLTSYAEKFLIQPSFSTEAFRIKRKENYWLTETNKGNISSEYVVLATGIYGRPKKILLPGMESFPGKIMHSSEYKTGRDFKGRRVLVVGFGNSACEIAIDLYEQGATPFLSVRSPVNIIPRDLFGIPVIQISSILSRLPPPVADMISSFFIKLRFGKIERFGLKKLKYGPYSQIRNKQTIPVIDIGIINHLKNGSVTVFPGIERIIGSEIVFCDDQKLLVDDIVAAVGFDRNVVDVYDFDGSVWNPRGFGEDNIYFCGARVSPRGAIREIASEARRIADDIQRKEKRIAVL